MFSPKLITKLQIYLLILYSCSKILVYMLNSNSTINTEIWCLLLDQVCPNEHHLPVPFPDIPCDGDGWVWWGVGLGCPTPHCSSYLTLNSWWPRVGGVSCSSLLISLNSQLLMTKGGWGVLLLIAHLT